MNKHQLLLFIFVIFSNLYAQFPHTDFEIVESIPLETNLDNDILRDTKTVWLEMINHADKTIDIEQFYIANDPEETLEPIIQAIEIKAAAGIRVRIIAEKRWRKPIQKLWIG